MGLNKKCPCCDLEMKSLDEKQRDNIIRRILKIGSSKNKKDDVVKAVEELENLEKRGYDVDSYFLVLKDFIERYLVVRRG